LLGFPRLAARDRDRAARLARPLTDLLVAYAHMQVRAFELAAGLQQKSARTLESSALNACPGYIWAPPQL